MFFKWLTAVLFRYHNLFFKYVHLAITSQSVLQVCSPCHYVTICSSSMFTLPLRHNLFFKYVPLAITSQSVLQVCSPCHYVTICSSSMFTLPLRHNLFFKYVHLAITFVITWARECNWRRQITYRVRQTVESFDDAVDGAVHDNDDIMTPCN